MLFTLRFAGTLNQVSDNSRGGLPPTQVRDQLAECFGLRNGMATLLAAFEQASTLGLACAWLVVRTTRISHETWPGRSYPDA